MNKVTFQLRFIRDDYFINGWEILPRLFSIKNVMGDKLHYLL